MPGWFLPIERGALAQILRAPLGLFSNESILEIPDWGGPLIPSWSASATAAHLRAAMHTFQGYEAYLSLLRRTATTWHQEVLDGKYDEVALGALDRTRVHPAFWRSPAFSEHLEHIQVCSQEPLLVDARLAIQEESVVTSRRPRLQRAAARSLGPAMCAHRQLQAMLIRNLTPLFVGYRPCLDQIHWSAIQELLRLVPQSWA
eukprot:2415006-Pyramimonas_sp.AAC.1